VVDQPASQLRELFREHVAAVQPDFFTEAPVPDRQLIEKGREQALDFFVNFLLYHEVDIRVRRHVVQTLAPLGVELWGEAGGWRPHLREGIAYRASPTWKRIWAPF